jgi:hypothetical protein
MMALVFGLFSKARIFEGKVTAEKPAMEGQKVASAGRKAQKNVRSAGPPQRQTKADFPTLPATLREVRVSIGTLNVLLLFALLPALSFGGWWDAYFSFSLYAANGAKANLFITQSLADRLPAELRKYVQPFTANYDPQHQGPLMLGFDPWCYEELHVPPIPEVRNFKAIFTSFRKYAQRPEELRMVIGPRAGPVIFLEGDRVELLRRK